MAKRNRKSRVGAIKTPPKIGTDPNHLIDVIIPVHQRFDLLKECLDAIPSAMGELTWKTIIFDNGSPKDQADIFYSSLPRDILVIRNKENIGFPMACNNAFNRGNAPLVFFLNDDVILAPNSIRPMVDAFSDPSVGIVGMKLIFPEYTDLPQDEQNRPSGKLQHIGLATNIRAEVIHQFIGWSPDHPKVNSIKEVFAVTGAALLTKRILFQKAGKFFEGYGRGTWEDVDYCMAAKQLGQKSIVVPEAVGIHHTGATAVTYGIGYPLQANRLIFLQRWSKFMDWTEINHW